MDANGNDVQGQSFELPAGASVDEDNGDFVVKDSSGTIVFRRNESAGEWQFEDADITGVSSLSTEKLNAVYQASEVISGLQSIHDAFDKAQADSGAEVWIVGSGTHTIPVYDTDLTDIDVQGFGDVTLASSDGRILDLPNATNLNFNAIAFDGALRFDGPPDSVQFHDCAHKGDVQWGRGSGTMLNCGHFGCDFVSGRITLFTKSGGNSGNGFEAVDCTHSSSSNLLFMRTDSGLRHKGLRVDGVNLGKNSLGINLTDASVDWSRISVRSNNTGTTSRVALEGYDSDVDAVMQNGYVHLLGGRDCDVEVDIEDTYGNSGVIVELVEPSDYNGNDGSSHTIRGHISGCAEAGVHLLGGTHCNLTGLTVKQNSRDGAGDWSGIQFDEITIDGSTYGSKNNIVSGVQAYDRLSSPMQEYGIEDVGTSDYNHILGGLVAPNRTGGVSMNTNSTVSGDVITTSN